MKQRFTSSVALSAMAMTLVGVTQYPNADNSQVANAQSTRLRPDLNGL